MALQSNPVWLSLRQFPLDDPAHAVPFSTRLRCEQGWSSAFTSRVLDEYRRFLFLTATHDELIVPSEAVDQAWHLHMLDTRAYWDELCGRAAGRPIHHTPSRGGATEDTRHADAYEATLRCYREAFDEPPPADIWPSAHERFAGRYRRFDTRDVWVIPKRVVRAGGGTGLMAVLAGCAKATSSTVTGFVLVGMIVAMFALLSWAAASPRGWGRVARRQVDGRLGMRGGGGGVVGGAGVMARGWRRMRAADAEARSASR